MPRSHLGLNRRALVKSVGSATAALTFGGFHVPAKADAPASPVTATSVASPTTGRLRGFAFNTQNQDVTRFDPTARRAIDTKPLGATVRWLSNEQRYWDGRYVWTYDFPDNQVQAIAVDPIAIAVARTIPTGGTGPAHSLMLTPDRATAWVNIAGDDMLTALDVGSGEVIAQVKTGKFP
jgi:hypothetical protein